MTVTRRASGTNTGLLASYAETLGSVVSRQRSEAAMAAAKIEAELANRAKTEFLANMSHELRTPLNAIIGFAQVLRDGIGLDAPGEKERQYAQNIHEAGRHLLGIISEILDIAKIENGSFELDLDEHYLEQIISECINLVGDRLKKKGQILAVDVEQGLGPVFIDKRRIKQVLLNLLSNAHKFTPEAGRIGISVRTNRANGIDLTVRDTGIGMTPQDIMRALQPFGQVQSAYARDHDGTGLGLPLAKGLVELHGGRLDVTSRAGIGTSVRFTLPPERVGAPQSPTLEVNGGHP